MRRLVETVRVVAVCGYKRSGKDEVGRVLVMRHGYVAEKLAAPLKEVVRVLFGLDESETDGANKERPISHWGGVTPRTLMQFFGTEVMQYKLQELVPGIGRAFWARALVARIEARIESEPALRTVVTDVRFPHEVAAMRDAFGDRGVFVVRVERAVSAAASAKDTHASELEHLTLPHDAVLTNDGSLADLQRSVDRMIAELGHTS